MKTKFEQNFEKMVAEARAAAQCQSSVSDCSVVCDRCKDANEKYVRRHVVQEVAKAKTLLQSMGFAVVEAE